MHAVQAQDQGRFGQLGLWLREGFAKQGVESAHYFSREFYVGDLVLAHGHRIGLVEDDVGGLKNRIAYQAVIHSFLSLVHLAHLVFEGWHTGQPAQGGDHAEQGVEGHDLRDVGLDEDNTLFWVNPGGEPVQHHIFYVWLDGFNIFA